MQRDLPDIEILKLYQKTKDNTYVSVILDRYKYFILKMIAQWHSSNVHRVKLTPSDFQDAQQNSYLAVLLMMNRVKNPDRIKNFATTIRSYMYTTLNKAYRYQKYEGLEPIRSTYARPAPQDIRKLYREDVRIYYRFHFDYNYYKLALMLTKLTKRASMKTQMYRVFFKFRRPRNV